MARIPSISAKLSLLLMISLCSTTSLARGFNGRDQKNSPPKSSARDLTEEQYEASLEEVCSKQEQERVRARAAGKIFFYSEECLPIDVASRHAKRLGERKHSAVCEVKRREEHTQAQKKQRIHLVSDCFNLIPDLNIEVEMTEPVDPIFQHPPDGIWKSVKFFSCSKSGDCQAVGQR